MPTGLPLWWTGGRCTTPSQLLRTTMPRCKYLKFGINTNISIGIRVSTNWRLLAVYRNCIRIACSVSEWRQQLARLLTSPGRMLASLWHAGTLRFLIGEHRWTSVDAETENSPSVNLGWVELRTSVNLFLRLYDALTQFLFLQVEVQYPISDTAMSVILTEF